MLPCSEYCVLGHCWQAVAPSTFPNVNTGHGWQVKFPSPKVPLGQGSHAPGAVAFWPTAHGLRREEHQQFTAAHQSPPTLQAACSVLIGTYTQLVLPRAGTLPGGHGMQLVLNSAALSGRNAVTGHTSRTASLWEATDTHADALCSLAPMIVTATTEKQVELPSGRPTTRSVFALVWPTRV